MSDALPAPPYVILFIIIILLVLSSFWLMEEGVERMKCSKSTKNWKSSH
ncbi:hypothetical protein V6Z12_D12G212400 [Gossypium hirsutum]